MLIQGLICKHDTSEGHTALYISSVAEPLAAHLESHIGGKQVTVRYWITDKQCTREEAIENHAKTLMGVGDAEFYAHYSEITGYLWTDENLRIGGHDLLEELFEAVGKWLILEIDVHGE